ncbi:MAG TPA: hypothetical protein VJL09_00230, partial [Candidatus Paceibacterota bacterium]
MKILAIETSCDETAIAVLEVQETPHQNKFGAGPRFSILSNLVASQVKIHALFGGVVPNLAKREHQRNLPILLKRALKESKLLNSKIKNQKSKIDAVAVTHGPGL